MKIAIRSVAGLATTALASTLLSSPALALDTSSLKACGDGAGWPPYTFEKGGQVQGYDVDVLNAIFASRGVDVSVEMPPWKRCVLQTKAGNYDIALSASFNEERDRDFLLTEYYYTLQPSYIYSTTQHPNGLQVNSVQDLDNLRMCGLLGYNYTGFGVDDSKVRKSAKSFEQLVQKTEAGRCDVFLARYEILAGFKVAQGIDYLADNMKAVAVPGNSGDKFYMMISREHPEANEIKATLDAGFKEMREAGQLQAMLDEYLN
ncbi:substrate-binding periplasmic protein [Salinivibrio proteolyticus]|uniref:Transporter substrate-binding domain-containing protein n=2 Tax=Gammaproteobacteria TaxID=1236 RepID=A0ABY7LLE3_9GAMM|nr:transporter substrate-binding domain-containing protein [Salinivibrio proteolyticus]WBA16320.1 transporter substrate-binding domain-containing protein [Salinivibrio proteolyticus]